MARLLTCGYESGDLAEAGVTVTGSGINMYTQAGGRFGGRYYLRLDVNATGWGGTYKRFDFPSSLSEVWVRFGFYAIPGNTEVGVFGFLDSAAGAQACVTYSFGDSQFRLRLGNGSGGTLLGTTTAGYAANTWHCVELHWQATSTTSGVMELFVNIVQAISFSGDNTNTANVNVASAWAGLNGSSATGAGTVCNVGFDDIAINDTTGTRNNGRIGDGRISRFMPTGAGGSTVLTRGGTDTGANWSQTSEVPPSMTQYVYSANAGDRDLYNLADISNVASINVVEEVVYALNSDASAGSMAPTIQSGSTVSEAAAQALSVAAAHYHARWETDPNTGAAWTAAAINALQAGATVR